MTLGLRSETDEHAHALIDTLDEVRSHAETRAYKQRSIQLAVLGACRILDAGCGTGDDVLSLAEAAQPGCEVVGIDARPALIEEAERRARNVALNVRFEVADAHALPLASQSFDVVRADRLLEDVADARRVLRELVRVLRIGGRILVHHGGPLSGHDDARARLALWLASLGVAGLEIVPAGLVLFGSECTRMVEGVTLLGTKRADERLERAGD